MIEVLVKEFKLFIFQNVFPVSQIPMKEETSKVFDNIFGTSILLYFSQLATISLSTLMSLGFLAVLINFMVFT